MDDDCDKQVESLYKRIFPTIACIATPFYKIQIFHLVIGITSNNLLLKPNLFYKAEKESRRSLAQTW